MTDQPTDRGPQEGATPPQPPLDLTDALQAAWLAMIALRTAMEWHKQRPQMLDPFLADMESIAGCLRAVVAATVLEAPARCGARDDLIVARERAADTERNLRKARESYARWVDWQAKYQDSAR